jgi:malate dehydrogenase
MDQIVNDTKVGGATLTGLLGTSAWYAPGAAVSEIVKAISLDSHKMIPCSALLDGEYGIEGLSIGVPCIIGKNGIEKIVEVSLSESEKNKLKESAAGVSKTNMLLD